MGARESYLSGLEFVTSRDLQRSDGNSVDFSAYLSTF